MNATKIRLFLCMLALCCLVYEHSSGQPNIRAEAVVRPSLSTVSSNYVGNREPLQNQYFIKLPVTAVKPGGWVRHVLELQRNGITGNLGEISMWLSKKDNAWLNKEGKGAYGWEELPYWLKGYANIGYMLGDKEMIAEAKFWIEAVLNNQRPEGDFGPNVVKKGRRDLWTNMPMLWCLQSYYEYSNDLRVLPFMTNYFRWELALPDSQFLKDYWENSRGGDNLHSVYWLYNRTGDAFLLDLASKIDKNTANWRQDGKLPNWHNVNIAQSFREPAQYSLQSGKPEDMQAAYNSFTLVRTKYGQVPGGMYGADENAREGYDDPRQAVETCGLVEQITSDNILTGITGDPFWADNAEDVAFNTLSAAFTPDYRALRYLTAPNMAVSDSKNHAPGINNDGPYLMMNPFSSRCCQHNHSACWVYYAENSWMATPDNGIAAVLYFENEVTAKVGNGAEVTIAQHTEYPFDDTIGFAVRTTSAVTFPMYFRVPAWCSGPVIHVNRKPVKVKAMPDQYIKLTGTWKDGDTITLRLPMKLQVRRWEKNKNSVSVNYGPLTYSLKIDEKYVQRDSKETAIGEALWQEGADPKKWPSFEIYPASPWNYGLVVSEQHPERSFTVVKKSYPKDHDPFTNANAPIELQAQGRMLPSWGIDQYGLVSILPQSPVSSNQPAVQLTLVPMGGARLRIAAFPVVK